MELREYQTAAAHTDCLSTGAHSDLLVPLLGLAGEVGELQSEYKKALRDGDAPELYRNRFAEELGDVMWYVADFATKLGFDLNHIAQLNLDKTRERWGRRCGLTEPRPPFDREYPEGERLPRRLRVELRTEEVTPGRKVVQA